VPLGERGKDPHSYPRALRAFLNRRHAGAILVAEASSLQDPMRRYPLTSWNAA
jgi:hypothetical protein